MIFELSIGALRFEDDEIYTDPVDEGLGGHVFRLSPQETHLMRNGNSISGIIQCEEGPRGVAGFIQRLAGLDVLRFDIPDGDGPVRLLL